jgi:hypothetical protein
MDFDCDIPVAASFCVFLGLPAVFQHFLVLEQEGVLRERGIHAALDAPQF